MFATININRDSGKMYDEIVKLFSAMDIFDIEILEELEKYFSRF
ncbi:hypothetical protein GCM10008905_20170 [Clostridium malenominatum]|uniref:Uncharacterized protein n=1 Tax=Clostridium malenominatum TaxID=1539 RepID=A0ABN1J0J2_9CLOT